MKITWIGHTCSFIEGREGRIATVEEFEGMMDNVRRIGDSTVAVSRE